MENAAKMMSGDVRSRTPAISAAICRSPQPRKNASSAVRSSEPITATTATVVDKRRSGGILALAPRRSDERRDGQPGVLVEKRRQRDHQKHHSQSGGVGVGENEVCPPGRGTCHAEGDKTKSRHKCSENTGRPSKGQPQPNDDDD